MTDLAVLLPELNSQQLRALHRILLEESHPHIDPFDFVESCEPNCTPERHSYHQGQWDLAERINKHWGLNPHPAEHIDCAEALNNLFNISKEDI